MQVLQAQLPAGELSLEDACPADAAILAQLYADVYQGEYSCPELFTAEGMAEFLAFERSRVATLKITLDGTLIGCVSCEMKGRAAYLRGGMIAPPWQGKVRAGAVFARAFQLFHARFGAMGRADYFYAETRTGNAKFHGILRDLGYSAYAILPRKDVFAGHRECEVVHAKYFRPSAPGPVRLTPRAAAVASRVLGLYVRPTLVIPPAAPGVQLPEYGLQLTRDPNGDEHWAITLASGVALAAIFCPASREIERVSISPGSIADYQAACACLLAEARRRGAEYVEVYAPATAPGRQNALETLGFSPAGFLPRWHAPGSRWVQDCVVYAITFPSPLPDCTPALIPSEEFLRGLVPNPFFDREPARLSPLLAKKTAAPALA